MCKNITHLLPTELRNTSQLSLFASHVTASGHWPNYVMGKMRYSPQRSAAAPAVAQTSPIAFLRGKMTTSFPTQVCRPQMGHLIAKSASKMIVCLVCKGAMVLRGAHIPLLRQRGDDLISPNFYIKISSILTRDCIS